MRVQFTYNQRDLIDANMRRLRRSKTFRSGRWQNTTFLIIFFWLATYVVFVSLLGNPYLAGLMFLFIAVLMIGFYPVFRDRAAEKRLRRFVRESYGDRDAFLCEVELTPLGVRIHNENSDSFFEWKLVEEIEATADSVDIFARIGGVVVRNRAFESNNTREEFIALARGYLANCRDKSE